RRRFLRGTPRQFDPCCGLVFFPRPRLASGRNKEQGTADQHKSDCYCLRQGIRAKDLSLEHDSCSWRTFFGTSDHSAERLRMLLEEAESRAARTPSSPSATGPSRTKCKMIRWLCIVRSPRRLVKTKNAHPTVDPSRFALVPPKRKR